MDRTVSGPLPLVMFAAFASVALTSCGSTSTTMADPGPSPATQTKHLAVSDSGDNRILIFDLPLTANSSANIAIGQPSLTQNARNQGGTTPTAATLDEPMGLAMDASGDLWVADNNNCRVLEYRPPFTTGMSASLVLGQADFMTSGPRSSIYCEPDFVPPISGTNIGSPSAVAFDKQGDLWVQAAGGYLEFVPPFSNGMEPTAVIGSPSLSTLGLCNGADYGEHGPARPPTAATICGGGGMVFDVRGNLWVTDAGNRRVLEYVPPFASGMSASLVIGQPTMTSFVGDSACDASANSLCDPNALAFDPEGDLWVSDWDFARVLEFAQPFTDGMAATVVLGQPDFTRFAGGYTAGPVLEPAGLAFDFQGNLMVIDKVGSEILVFNSPFSNGMAPATVVTSGFGNCPATGPTANSLCGAYLGLTTY